LQGQVFVLFTLTVAACEAALALALFLMLYKSKKTLDVSVWQDLREADLDPVEDEEPLPPAPREAPSPHLPIAGPAPAVQEQEQSHV
jgi:NADH-quinone oxidoreductase subunit K